MLQLVIPAIEAWDDEKQEFINRKERVLQLEHSLVSLSKWESKWCKPFLSQDAKTHEETVDYIKCMTITQNVDPETYRWLTDDNIAKVNKYIEAPMTATTFAEDKTKANKEIITAEIIYYWMIALNIPFECRKWHLNQLLTLIRVCNIKNSPPKKRGKRETTNYYAKLNAERRKAMNSKG